MIVPATADFHMKPADRYKVPPHDKLLVSNRQHGVTVIGKFQPGFHTHWCELPKYLDEDGAEA